MVEVDKVEREGPVDVGEGKRKVRVACKSLRAAEGEKRARREKRKTVTGGDLDPAVRSCSCVVSYLHSTHLNPAQMRVPGL